MTVMYIFFSCCIPDFPHSCVTCAVVLIIVVTKSVSLISCLLACKSYKWHMLSVGDLTDDNAAEDDKPLNSVALAKFLSKAAKVTVLSTQHALYFMSNFECYTAATCPHIHYVLCHV